MLTFWLWGSVGGMGTEAGRCWPLLILRTKELRFYMYIGMGDRPWALAKGDLEPRRLNKAGPIFSMKEQTREISPFGKNNLLKKLCVSFFWLCWIN